jgi:hypothetical protein
MLSGMNPREIVRKKREQDPKNYTYRLLETAFNYEQKGDIKKALYYYECCKSDDFAQSRIDALSPLKFTSVVKKTSKEQNASKSLINILSHEENMVFNAMITIRTRKQVLTRDKIVHETGLPKERVFAALEGLQKKGYIGKIEKLYRYIQILKYPVIRNGVIGSLPEIEEALPQKKPLTFSFSRLSGRKGDFSLWSDSSLESIESVSSQKSRVPESIDATSSSQEDNIAESVESFSSNSNPRYR